MGYQAGDLKFNMSVAYNSVSQSITDVINKLTKLESVLANFNFGNVSKWSDGFKNIDTSNIDSFSKSINQSASKIIKFEKLDYSKIAKGFNTLATAVQPFITELNKGEASLNSFYNALNTIATTKSNKSNDNLDFAAALHNLRQIVNVVKSVVRGIYKITQYGADFTETLNLWAVAMENNLDSADKFIKKMSEAYGISKKTLMNAQATFKNMVGTLGGVSDELAYKTSETITQMAVDFASLYNTTFEEAFTKFKAVLSGQVRPIRSVSGYDITENTLEELYKSLGGTKSVRNLTQTEKRLLSIRAIFNQMEKSGAVGDMAKTFDTFANRSRQLSETWEDLKTSVGIVFQYILESTNIMEVLIAFVRVFGDVFTALANTLGYDQKKEINTFAKSFEDTTSEINATDEALNNLKKQYLDFDKFRTLSSSGGNTELDVDEIILSAINGYNGFLGAIENDTVKKAVEVLRKFFGVFEDEEGNLKLSISGIAGLITTITSLTGLIVTLLGVGLGKKVVSLLQTLFSINKTLGSIAGAFAAFAATFTILNGVLSLFEGKAKAVASAITAIAGAALAAIAIIKWQANPILIATGVAAIIAGVTNFADAVSNIQKHAMGASDIQGGSLFIAGEMGKTEMVYSGENGKSNVANISQLQRAVYGALTDWSAQNGNNQVITVELDGETVYRNTTNHASKRGEHWSR